MRSSSRFYCMSAKGCNSPKNVLRASKTSSCVSKLSNGEVKLLCHCGRRSGQELFQLVNSTMFLRTDICLLLFDSSGCPSIEGQSSHWMCLLTTKRSDLLWKPNVVQYTEKCHMPICFCVFKCNCVESCYLYCKQKSKHLMFTFLFSVNSFIE